MSKRFYIIAGGIFLLIIVFFVMVFALAKKSNTSNVTQVGVINSPTLTLSNQTSHTISIPSSPPMTPPPYQPGDQVIFSTSVYKQYSYQLFPGTISAQTKSKLQGFTLNKVQNTDDSTTIILHVDIPGYSDLSVTAQSTDTVYLLKPADYQDPGDIGLVVVNQQGYIVPQQ